MFATAFTSNNTSPSQSHVVAAGRGVQLIIALTEPVVFLEGHTGKGVRHTNKPAVLRGYLRLNIIKPVKIKRLCIYFRGCIHMGLPEGVPFLHARWTPSVSSCLLVIFHLSVKHLGRRSLISSGITYFDRGDTARSYNAFGADFYHLSDEPSIAIATGQDVEPAAQPFKGDRYPTSETAVHPLANSSAIKPRDRKSYPATSPRQGQDQLRLFPPGDYIYGFEFLVHNSLPESIRTDLSSIHYNIETVLERSGFFRSTMTGTLDVPLVRLPGDSSLEHIEPITFSRTWRNQLCYDLFVSCRSRPLGSQIPMRLKLVALANLACHSISVYMSEHIQYQMKGREAPPLRLPDKKVLLFQKQAGLTSYSTYAGGSIRVISGQGINSTRDMQTPNLLGDLSEETEIELKVQLPRCPQMAQKEKKDRLYFSVNGESLAVNHRIQVSGDPSSAPSEPHHLAFHEEVTT